MGLIGIPVFSSGGGYTYVLMPSFGFIIGFLFASIIIGFASKSNKFYMKYILSFIGLVVINVCGSTYMYIIMNYYMELNKDISYILSVGVLPFIAKDFIVAILSCIIYSRIQLALYPKDTEITEINLNKNENSSI
jgi:biotin transport system substrate-specific component